MIVDLERDTILPEFSADVCIVGAGAAGIVLAAELERQGRRVLLLESGGASLEPAAQELNACTYVGQPRRGVDAGHSRALGGTTTTWGGQILEMDAEDFTARPWVPGSGWPFSKGHLAPFYERALLAEGLSDVIRADERVWQEMKIPAPHLGNGLSAYCTRWCPEPNFASLYKNILASPNLCVLVHATATAMTFTENRSRFDGIRCKTPSGREYVFSAGQYVLCLGTIESVRFLMQPIPDTRTSPWNRSGLLGCHFQSHIDLNAAQVPMKSAVRLQRWFANVYLHGHKYHPKFRLTSPLQRQEQILSVAGSITCINQAEPELRRSKSLMRNFVRHGAFGNWSDLPGALRQMPTLLRLGYGYAVEHRAYWPKRSTFWLRVHCEQEPLSPNQIALTDIRDASGLLQAKVDWHVSPWEWKTIRRFTEQVQSAFADDHWERLDVLPELAQDDGYRSVTFDDSHHDMGGTRMAVSSAEGVVDPNLKLHGVENAYVCSASVFPTSGFSNPTHTLIALAIRLADHLKENARA